MSAGIYCIENSANNKKYVGLSTDLQKRWKKHKHLLNKGTHGNTHLQSSFNAHGINSFAYYILEECLNNPDILNEREKYWIKHFNTTNPSFGYNYKKGGESVSGYHHSEECKRNMSLAKKGIPTGRTVSPLTAEARKRISDKLKGRPLTEEWKRKISEGMKAFKQREKSEVLQI